ncbi:hypothetical protein SteCoe_6966 [Stentor coeruleus]|uniref:Exportin-T n=1 Tax=Stentor coeruleus TaxID=5963 RepID=A0A1R2CNX8_9CILI|nr:hypothetical protein SteCoe_6966 [Stentor coeruleus]
MVSFEQAINILFDPSQPQQIKKSAMEMTEAAKQSLEFYKFAMQKVIELNLEFPNSLNLLFWYLQALEEVINKNYKEFPHPAHTEIQNFLFMVVDSRLDIIQKHYGILNKFSVLYVRVLQVDFPVSWPLAFQILIDRAQRSPIHAKLFLSVMKAFSEEFTEEYGYLTQEQLKRSSELKDAIKERVLRGASDIWKVILDGEDQSLSSGTLQVMKNYIPWIPLELSLAFFPYFCKYLNLQATQVPALQCIDSIVNKKMEPQKKYEIIQKLNLITFIQNFSFEAFDMLSDVPKIMASLIDSLAENLLDIEIGNEFFIVFNCVLKCLNTVEPEVSSTVFGAVSKYIRAIKFKESQKQEIVINSEEHKFLNSIRSILMTRAKLPNDFEHVGPENSEEEDQFYKYRTELADIFKNTLDISGVKETVLDELFSYFSTLNTHSQAEDIELPLFLIYHFAEKVQNIGNLLKSPNKYTDLIGMIVKFPIPQHKIVIKAYLENIVRYSAYFDEDKINDFHYALEHFLVNLRNPDKSVKKHAIYMLYRLAIKNPSLLVLNAQQNFKTNEFATTNQTLYVEIILKSISEAISSEFLEADSVNQLYKTIGMIIGFKKIDPQVQIQLFNRLCDMIISRASKESITAFIEVLSGFTSEVHNEMVPKLKQTAEIILSFVLQSEKSNDTINSTCLLLQKLIDTLEIESGIYIKTGLEHLIESVNMDTLENFFSVISNFCHKINKGYEIFIPLDPLRKLVIQIMNNIPIPNETISDLAQQAISVRRSLIKFLTILLTKFPQFFDFPEILNLPY